MVFDTGYRSIHRALWQKRILSRKTEKENNVDGDLPCQAGN